MSDSPILAHLREMINGGQGTGLTQTMQTAGVSAPARSSIQGMLTDFGKSAASRALLDYGMQNRLFDSQNGMSQWQMGNQVANANAQLMQRAYGMSLEDQLRQLGRQAVQSQQMTGVVSPIIQQMLGSAY